MPVSRPAIVSRLHQDPLFRLLSDQELESLASLMSYREYPKGAFIITKNDLSHAVYMLLSGRVKVSVASPEGRELALHYLEAPGYFGDSRIGAKTTQHLRTNTGWIFAAWIIIGDYCSIC